MSIFLMMWQRFLLLTNYLSSIPPYSLSSQVFLFRPQVCICLKRHRWLRSVLHSLLLVLLPTPPPHHQHQRRPQTNSTAMKSNQMNTLDSNLVHILNHPLCFWGFVSLNLFSNRPKFFGHEALTTGIERENLGWAVGLPHHVIS